MSPVLDRSRPASDGGRVRPGNLLPSPAQKGRRARALASGLLVFASIAAFVGVYERIDHRVPVLVVVRAVHLGQRVDAQDLGEASAAVAGPVVTIPYAALGSVIGQHAAVALVPGSLLTPADLSRAQSIPPGDAVVGMALKSDQMPSSGVIPGDIVMVVQSASSGPSPVPVSVPGGADSTTGVLVPDATVYEVVPPQPGPTGSVAELVSVEMSSTLAAQVSVAAASDQVSLVLLPQNGTGS